VEVAIAALSISVERPGTWVLVPEELHNPLEQMLAVPKSAPTRRKRNSLPPSSTATKVDR
jgi:hypothetical protein